MQYGQRILHKCTVPSRIPSSTACIMLTQCFKTLLSQQGLNIDPKSLWKDLNFLTRFLQMTRFVARGRCVFTALCNNLSYVRPMRHDHPFKMCLYISFLFGTSQAFLTTLSTVIYDAWFELLYSMLLKEFARQMRHETRSRDAVP